MEEFGAFKPAIWYWPERELVDLEGGKGDPFYVLRGNQNHGIINVWDVLQR